MFTKSIKNIIMAAFVGCGIAVTVTSCSDSYMNEVNTDDSKGATIDPNSQLTTALLQTYGDFGMMDTYRSYISGFTQHMAGGWNVTNYAGSVHAADDQMSLVWDRLYTIAIKNLVDGIDKSNGSRPNLNAALRIHKVYLMSILTDIYGDVPCSEAGQGFLKDINNPRYDKQEEIYNFFFDELAACVAQLGTGSDRITGDVTSMGGDTEKWKMYANSLRLRFAMRISDVNPAKAQQEFEKALQADGGYITSATNDAFVVYLNSPFTLYDGSRELDFRANALGEIWYGQDYSSPTFICTTFYNLMANNSDPRLFRICRHYINTKRSNIQADRAGNVDLTEEVEAYIQRAALEPAPCNPGAAWYNNWVSAPANSEIPTLAKMVEQDPEAGYDKDNCNARMMRPFLSIDFEQADAPGPLMTYAEVEFLLAEALSKGWNVGGTLAGHYEAGVRAAIDFLNTNYLQNQLKISADETDTYVNALLASGELEANPRKAIATQAYIHHMTNPSEAWANLRRADYPVMMDRSKLDKFDGFTYDDNNMDTPVRLRYPSLEVRYNNANYMEALNRMGGRNDWHKRMWWDTADINVE
jgi:hypothetical protein